MTDVERPHHRHLVRDICRVSPQVRRGRMLCGDREATGHCHSGGLSLKLPFPGANFPNVQPMNMHIATALSPPTPVQLPTLQGRSANFRNCLFLAKHHRQAALSAIDPGSLMDHAHNCHLYFLHQLSLQRLHGDSVSRVPPKPGARLDHLAFHLRFRSPGRTDLSARRWYHQEHEY